GHQADRERKSRQGASHAVRRVEEGRIEAVQQRSHGVEQHEPVTRRSAKASRSGARGFSRAIGGLVMTGARVRGVLPAALAMSFVTASAFSQALTGTITGRALDAGGGVLPGVEVAVSSPALIGGARTIFADSQGVYRATQLPSGEYRVTFKL